MSTSGFGKKVTVIDYGLGNLFSIERALTHLGAQVEMTSDPGAVLLSKGLVLPGVGAFGDGINQLKTRGLADPIRKAVGSGRPLLGICLGMQLLFSKSEEFGRHEGLGLVEGTVARLEETDPLGHRVKVPHVGWSGLTPSRGNTGWSSSVFEGLDPGDAMYFVHSYVPFPQQESVVVARFEYGGHAYCAAVEDGSLIGCQFHPEKSGKMGLKLLENFISRISDANE